MRKSVKDARVVRKMSILPLPPFIPSASLTYLVITMFTQAVKGSAVHVLKAEVKYFQEPDCIVLPGQQEIISLGQLFSGKQEGSFLPYCSFLVR